MIKNCHNCGNNTRSENSLPCLKCQDKVLGLISFPSEWIKQNTIGEPITDAQSSVYSTEYNSTTQGMNSDKISVNRI